MNSTGDETQQGERTWALDDLVSLCLRQRVAVIAGVLFALAVGTARLALNPPLHEIEAAISIGLTAPDRFIEDPAEVVQRLKILYDVDTNGDGVVPRVDTVQWSARDARRIIVVRTVAAREVEARNLIEQVSATLIQTHAAIASELLGRLRAESQRLADSRAEIDGRIALQERMGGAGEGGALTALAVIEVANLRNLRETAARDQLRIDNQIADLVANPTRLVEPAAPLPESGQRPVRKTLLAAGFLGLVLGLGLAIGREVSARRRQGESAPG